MRINASLADISDGKLYDVNDMVKADTAGCKGCSACCHDVEDTIVLNPYDMYRLLKGTGSTYEALTLNKGESQGQVMVNQEEASQKIGTHVEDKLLYHHLLMVGEEKGCGFLDENERCLIHDYRPSICRLFPLGRYYEEDDFKYFFKEGECIKPKLSKVKVKKWIGIANYRDNKEFILSWHEFLKALKFRVKFIRDDKELEEVNDYLVETFFRWDQAETVEDAGFYDLYYKKLVMAKDKLGVL